MLIYSWGNIIHTHTHTRTNPMFLTEVFWNSVCPTEERESILYFHFVSFSGKYGKPLKKKKKHLYYKEWCPKTAEERMLKERRTHDFPPRHIFFWHKGNERASVVCCMCVAMLAGEKEVERFKRTGKGLKRHTYYNGGKSRNICLLVCKVKNHLKEHLGIKQRPFAAKTTSTVLSFFRSFS